MIARVFPALLLLASAADAQDIHRVDFRNREWRDTCLDAVRTRDGSFERRTGSMLGNESFEVDRPIFGDLDGDGADEAIVLTHCNGGGVGRFDNGIVFAMRGSRLRELVRLGEGDRADGGIEGVRIDAGIIVERRYATWGGARDFDYLVTHRRGLFAGGLVELEPAALECASDYPENCLLTSGRLPEVRFEPDRTRAIRFMTFDANGRLPELPVRAESGQSMDVAVRCAGTPAERLSVAPPAGAATEAVLPEWHVELRAAQGGLYRVTAEARPVGFCTATVSVW